VESWYAGQPSPVENVLLTSLGKCRGDAVSLSSHMIEDNRPNALGPISPLSGAGKLLKKRRPGGPSPFGLIDLSVQSAFALRPPRERVF
jgi:hypothetical protein